MKDAIKAHRPKTTLLGGVCAFVCAASLAAPARSVAAEGVRPGSNPMVQGNARHDNDAHNTPMAQDEKSHKDAQGRIDNDRDDRMQPNSGGGITKGELENFDTFLDSHPDVRKDVAAHPRLLDDENYIKQHPGLGEFLSSHPGVRQEAKQNPQRFMAREGQYGKNEDASANAANSGGGITKGELENFDGFLDTHPGIREQVAKNPRLLSDDKFVDSHPGLRDFLSGHPGVRQEAEQNPQRFMAREQQYQKREDAEGRAH